MALSKVSRYLLAYIVVSAGLLAWLVYDLLLLTSNFLSFVSELTDGYKLLIVVNFLFLFAIAIAKFVQWVLFGELRIIESEHLVEKLPFVFVNLLLVVSQDDNIIFNCVLLLLTILSKTFHIILMDRVDFFHMKIVNNSSNETYTRTSVVLKYALNVFPVLLVATVVLDFMVAKLLAYDVFQGVNSVVCLLIGFHFAVEGVQALTYLGKLLLNIYELVVYRVGHANSDEDDDEDDELVWENKGLYTKSVDIASASLRAVSHLGFIYLLMFHSGSSLPLSILHSTFSALRSLVVEVKLLLSFIELSKRLDSQLQDATDEDLNDVDSLCIICREDMHLNAQYRELHNTDVPTRKKPKKLRCNHILHMGCLKDWLERLENCPLCRRSVFAEEQPAPDPQPPAAAQAAEVAAQAADQDNLPNAILARAFANQAPLTAAEPPPPSSNSSTPIPVISTRDLPAPPRDWAIFPIQRRDDGFDVVLLPTLTATLKARDLNDL